MSRMVVVFAAVRVRPGMDAVLCPRVLPVGRHPDLGGSGLRLRRWRR
jgi:hypothetical protein